jgi:hypothetical protein
MDRWSIQSLGNKLGDKLGDKVGSRLRLVDPPHRLGGQPAWPCAAESSARRRWRFAALESRAWMRAMHGNATRGSPRCATAVAHLGSILASTRRSGPRPRSRDDEPAPSTLRASAHDAALRQARAIDESRVEQ